MYGFDQSDWFYRTDHQGNRLRADIPYKDLAAMLEIVTAARRANTAALEARTPKGANLKSSLGQVAISSSEQSSGASPPDLRQTILRADTTPSARNGRDALEAIFSGVPIPNELLQAIPRAEAPAPAPKAKSVARIGKATTGHGKPLHPQPTRFLEAPPSEVQVAIDSGVHYLRAWREYRGYTRQEAAELYGCSADNISKYELPTRASMRKEPMRRFSQAYDCTVDQLTPHPKQPRCKLVIVPETGRDSAEQAAAKAAGPRFAPDGTQWPDGVLKHARRGLGMVAAWREYRDMTLKGAAEQYGCTAQAFKVIEGNASMRDKTREKLARVFHCKPEQLLLPIEFEVTHQRRATPTMSVASA